MWGGFFDDEWRRKDLGPEPKISFFFGSDSESSESESSSDTEDNVQKLEAEFEAAKETFYTKGMSLNAKIKAFDAFINSPAFQAQIDRIEQPAFMTGAYYFKALGHSRIGTPKALQQALDALEKIDSPSSAHRILQAECLEKLGKIKEAKDIFSAVESMLLSLPAVRQGQHKSYDSCMERILSFNKRHGIETQKAAMSASEEREIFGQAKSFTPLSSLKKTQSKTTSVKPSELKIEDARYTVPVSNRFEILRKLR